MSADPSGGDPSGGDPSGEEPFAGGRLHPTSVGALVGSAGSAWSPAGCCTRSRSACRTPPIVAWTQVLVPFLMAAVLGAVAFRTWREVHVRHERLEPHRAVNRLVLARACAFVGAFVAGGYLGYAISWIGVDAVGGAASLAIGDRGPGVVWRSP